MIVYRTIIHLNIELQIPVIYRADFGLRGFTPLLPGGGSQFLEFACQVSNGYKSIYKPITTTHCSINENQVQFFTVFFIL